MRLLFTIQEEEKPEGGSCLGWITASLPTLPVPTPSRCLQPDGEEVNTGVFLRLPDGRGPLKRLGVGRPQSEFREGAHLPPAFRRGSLGSHVRVREADASCLSSSKVVQSELGLGMEILDTSPPRAGGLPAA